MNFLFSRPNSFGPFVSKTCKTNPSAGLVARRIVTDTSVEENVDQGSRIGMIRFGSRADLYFENYEPLVKVNQRAVAGETLIAKR